MKRLVLYVLLVALLWGTCIPAASFAQAATTLSVEPPTQTVTAGAEFNLSVMMDSGVSPVDGVQVTLAYDTSRLLVVGLIAGNVLSDILQQGYDNDLGRVRYAAGKMLGEPPRGRFEIVQVRFQALTPTLATAVELSIDPPLPSKVSSSGSNLSSNLVDSIVLISQGDLPPAIPTDEPTATATRVPTSTATVQPTPIGGTSGAQATDTPTLSGYPGPSPIRATQTPARQATGTATTATASRTPAGLGTPAAGQTRTPTRTATRTVTRATSPSRPAGSPTATASPSLSPTATASATPKVCTVTPTATATATPDIVGGWSDMSTGSRILSLLAIVLIGALAIGFAFARRNWLSG